MPNNGSTTISSTLEVLLRAVLAVEEQLIVVQLAQPEHGTRRRSRLDRIDEHDELGLWHLDEVMRRREPGDVAPSRDRVDLLVGCERLQSPHRGEFHPIVLDLTSRQLDHAHPVKARRYDNHDIAVRETDCNVVLLRATTQRQDDRSQQTDGRDPSEYSDPPAIHPPNGTCGTRLCGSTPGGGDQDESGSDAAGRRARVRWTCDPSAVRTSA